jgi:hypothetical protein
VRRFDRVAGCKMSGRRSMMRTRHRDPHPPDAWFATAVPWRDRDPAGESGLEVGVRRTRQPWPDGCVHAITGCTAMLVGATVTRTGHRR